MNNYFIKSIPVNIFSGKFNTTINFNNHLNIISGVNGTGKTKLLTMLKTNLAIVDCGNNISKTIDQLNIFPISPKRNTIKQTIDYVSQQYRQQNKSQETFLNVIKGLNIRDDGFESYSPFAELFIICYEELMKNGTTTYKDAISKVRNDFNEVLKKVFPNYEIVADWTNEKIKLQIKKYNLDPLNIENLSTGEQEVFALLFNIYVSREKEDIYLIDEPEVHLNWNLEKGLFDFFEWFCTNFDKQIIVVTHSRVIFKENFYSKTQFLLWENSQIVCKKEITKEEKLAIAGELADAAKVIEFNKNVFFVEDDSHKLILEKISQLLSKNIDISVCGNKSTVQSIYRLLKINSESLKKSYFLIDGDNENNKINDDHFICLSKYCIENYLFDIPILAKTFNVSEDDIKLKITESIKENSHDKHTLVYKKLAEQSTTFPFDIMDNFDCSKIIDRFSKKYSKKRNDLINEFMCKAKDENKLEIIFNEIISKL